MNSQTKKAIQAFALEAAQVAVGSVHMIGVEQAQKMTEKATALFEALESDETIVEVR